MVLLSRSSAFSRVTALAEQRPLHEAFRWLHLHGQQMLHWQAELVTIPAPPFGEEMRSLWMAEQFRLAGLGSVDIDGLGNVFGELAGADSDETEAGPVVLLSAHLDTVFPADTPLKPLINGDLLEAPGACDNAAGVIGMLGIAHALVKAQMPLGAMLVFVGNVGEEGEGDLRGVREIYQHSRYAGRIAAHVVLDGAGAETAVTQALGSKRFQVTITGPGGHSFTDSGTVNPIPTLGLALANLAQTTVPDEPRTTLNVGTIQGGTSVNTIPEMATAAVDFRSTDMRELVRLEVALHRAVEDSVDLANGRAAARELKREGGRGRNQLSFAIETIGDRPAANLPPDSPILEALRAVDRHLGLRTDLRLGSTDANIPLALGIPAVSLGAGGDGGGAHTRGEWYSAVNRELGLRRILLLTLAMLEWTGQSIG
ncbi:M20/M25/M40 family metallo-hydrolase [Acidicapsa ligni]|uniref:M20/M25/M40 family metallo-hydrolase n=1 Tax=Acidicapsa ligni TaxID=542300 RepID=UPI0021E08C74|nr:M20/M25/M40 family metallo-hydrolase [Acidicapsa ligni]